MVLVVVERIIIIITSIKNHHHLVSIDRFGFLLNDSFFQFIIQRCFVLFCICFYFVFILFYFDFDHHSKVYLFWMLIFSLSKHIIIQPFITPHSQQSATRNDANSLSQSAILPTPYSTMTICYNNHLYL